MVAGGIWLEGDRFRITDIDVVRDVATLLFVILVFELVCCGQNLG